MDIRVESWVVTSHVHLSLIYITGFYDIIMSVPQADLLLGLYTPLLWVMDGSVTLSLCGMSLQQLDAG